MDDFECPHCGYPNSVSTELWKSIGKIPVICGGCDKLFWSPLHSLGDLITVIHPPIFKVEVPPLIEGDLIYVINKEHPKHLEPGKIVNKSHLHYRIEFNDGTLIWMPHHWIEKVPF